MTKTDAASRLRALIDAATNVPSQFAARLTLVERDIEQLRAVLDELEQLRAEQRRQIDLAYGAGWYDATYQAVAGRGPDMKGQVAGLRKYHQELEARSPDADGAR